MVVNFERMSTNLIDVIDEVLNNNFLLMFIAHDGNLPLPSGVTINKTDIAPMGSNQKIYPYPFDFEYTESVSTFLHIYYPSFSFENNGHASKIILNFDIIVHKDIWLMLDNGKKVVRPYQITKYIIDTFKGKKIGNLGELHFVSGTHMIVNDKYEGIRLSAKFTEF